MNDEKLKGAIARIKQGGAPKYHEKNSEQKKLFARDRVRLLVDEGSFVEDALLANASAGDLPADGVITGGSLTVAGIDVLALKGDALRAYHRDTFSMVYQNPGTALNPTLRISRQLIGDCR